MNFTPEMLALIRERRKNQERIPAKRLQSGSVEPCRYQVGHLYKAHATQLWTAKRLSAHRRRLEIEEPTRARAVLEYLTSTLDATSPRDLEITIITVEQQPLGAITPADARREGFRFVSQFLKHWEQRYGTADPHQPTWTIGFAVGDHTDMFDHVTLLRAGSPAVAICAGCKRGLPDGTTRCPRCGKERPPERSDDHGYTSRLAHAMRDEKEVMRGPILKPYIDQAHANDADRAHAARAALPRASRLQAIEQAAAMGDRQAQRHLFVIDQRIQAAEEKRAREAA